MVSPTEAQHEANAYADDVVKPGGMFTSDFVNELVATAYLAGKGSN